MSNTPTEEHLFAALESSINGLAEAHKVVNQAAYEYVEALDNLSEAMRTETIDDARLDRSLLEFEVSDDSVVIEEIIRRGLIKDVRQTAIKDVLNDFQVLRNYPLRYAELADRSIVSVVGFTEAYTIGKTVISVAIKEDRRKEFEDPERKLTKEEKLDILYWLANLSGVNWGKNHGTTT